MCNYGQESFNARITGHPRDWNPGVITTFILSKSIQYTFDSEVGGDEVFSLLDRMDTQSSRFPASAVFHRSLRSPEKERIALENSINVSARSGQELVGFLRIVTDGSYIFYIVDVMVDPDYQSRGIGTKLVLNSLEEMKKRGFMKIFLTAIPGSEPFYESLGFNPSMSPVLTIRGEDYMES